MGIRLGNLTVKEIEERCEIVLSEEDRHFLEQSRQENVSIPIEANKWHCFDMPFLVCCGSKTFATVIYERLRNYEIKGQLGIGWDKEEK